MNYSAQEIQNQITPLSANGFVAFWQKLWRKWLGVWYGFAEKHPKAAQLIQQFVVMYLFSNLVTIWQMLIMMFLPYAFQSMWYTPFVWPAIALPWTDAAGTALNYAIFNEPVKFLNAAKESILASTAEAVEMYKANSAYTYEISGLGNFIAFEIATFTAQCINFPLQRNVTFKSHGNPYYQAMWYFIGWVLISVGLNAVWGIINPILMHWNWNKFIIDLIKTVLTGGVSMVIFFFIFRIIFPDRVKEAENLQKAYDNLVASGASQDKIDAAKAKLDKAQYEALLVTTEKDESAAVALANTKAIKYFAVVDSAEKAKGTPDEAKFAESVEKAYADVCEAIVAKEKAIKAREEALANPVA